MDDFERPGVGETAVGCFFGLLGFAMATGLGVVVILYLLGVI